MIKKKVSSHPNGREAKAGDKTQQQDLNLQQNSGSRSQEQLPSGDNGNTKYQQSDSEEVTKNESVHRISSSIGIDPLDASSLVFRRDKLELEFNHLQSRRPLAIVYGIGIGTLLFIGFGAIIVFVLRYLDLDVRFSEISELSTITYAVAFWVFVTLSSGSGYFYYRFLSKNSQTIEEQLSEYDKNTADFLEKSP